MNGQVTTKAAENTRGALWSSLESNVQNPQNKGKTSFLAPSRKLMDVHVLQTAAAKAGYIFSSAGPWVVN